MCDVPSIAVFCNESIECFPGKASKFFLKLLVSIPVAPIITGIIVYFKFHIRCISIHKLLYFNFFSASICTTYLSALIIIVIINLLLFSKRLLLLLFLLLLILSYFFHKMIVMTLIRTIIIIVVMTILTTIIIIIIIIIKPFFSKR